MIRRRATMIKLIRSANCFTLTLWLLIVGFIAIGSIGGCNNDSRGSSGLDLGGGGQ